MAEKEYIEREKLPRKKERGFFLDDDFNAGWNACLNNIASIPAADVRPMVRAEFVRCGDGKSVPFMCTHCGKTVPANLVEIWGVNYCPNCGARMEES